MIEHVEGYLRNSIEVMSQPYSCISKSYEQIVQQYPNYIRSKVELFRKHNRQIDWRKDYIEDKFVKIDELLK